MGVLVNEIGSVPYQNLLLNADMALAQRGSSFAAVANGSNVLDRYQYNVVGAAVHTISQDTDVPTFAQANYLFQNSIRLNLTTPDTSIAAGDSAFLTQKIEGYRFAAIAQKTFTLSFWVKATLAGTYCIGLRNSAADRSYVAEYTINSSATWEYKTITFPASPAAGTWNYTNGVGLAIAWTIAAGSTLQTAAGSWTTGSFIASSNQVNGVNTGSTDFRLTGVMVNEGASAQPFRLAGGGNFQQELALCQRYYEKSYRPEVAPQTMSGAEGYISFQNSGTATVVRQRYMFKVVKRSTPTTHIYPVLGSFADQTISHDVSGNQAVGSVQSDSMCIGFETATNNTGDIRWYFHFTSDAEL